MTTITIDEIQRDVIRFLRKVQAGEAFLIIQEDRPVAEMRPVSSRVNGARPAGLCSGEFEVPDDFDAPLPEDAVRPFEES